MIKRRYTDILINGKGWSIDVKRFNIVGNRQCRRKAVCRYWFSHDKYKLVNFEDTLFLENIIYNELKARDYEVFTGKHIRQEIDFVG
ncbi:MAG: hypothetical protein ACLRMX_02540 [Lachnospira eligens]